MGGCVSCFDKDQPLNSALEDRETSKGKSCYLQNFLVEKTFKTGINSGRAMSSEETMTSIKGDHSTSSINKQDFKILKVIGRGSFGKVYLV